MANRRISVKTVGGRILFMGGPVSQYFGALYEWALVIGYFDPLSAARSQKDNYQN